jgi:hypothetical protein
MAQLESIRMPDGTVVKPGEWTSAVPLYSTIEIAAGPFPGLIAFSYGQGGPVPGSQGPRNSTLIDTNLQGEGGRLPENEELISYSLAIEVFKIGAALTTNEFPDADVPGVPATDMLRLQRDMTVRFRVASVRDYTSTPISFWPAGTGVYYTISGGRSKVSGAAPNGEIIGNNGSPSINGRRQLASPIYVGPGEQFGVDFIAGPGEVKNLNLATNARLRTRVDIDGLRRRPVA